MPIPAGTPAIPLGRAEVGWEMRPDGNWAHLWRPRAGLLPVGTSRTLMTWSQVVTVRQPRRSRALLRRPSG